MESLIYRERPSVDRLSHPSEHVWHGPGSRIKYSEFWLKPIRVPEENSYHY